MCLWSPLKLWYTCIVITVKLYIYKVHIDILSAEVQSQLQRYRQWTKYTSNTFITNGEILKNFKCNTKFLNNNDKKYVRKGEKGFDQCESKETVQGHFKHFDK